MGAGRNLVSIGVCVLRALNCFVVETATPKTQSLRRCLQLDPRPPSWRLSPHLRSGARRTSQAMAGAFALACGLLIHFGLSTAAYVVEGMFLAAVLALTLGGFCPGIVRA